MSEKWVILAYLCVLLSLCNPKSSALVPASVGWAHSPSQPLDGCPEYGDGAMGII